MEVAMPLEVQHLVQREALRRSLRSRVAVPSPSPPCIALSRLPGSDAAGVGQEIARQLDFTFFGIEIVDRIARDAKLPRALAASFDERVRSSIDRYVVDAFRAGAFLESDYLRALVRTVRSIGAAGASVLLGRGSPYILPAGRTLRVFVVAPREKRLERLAKARGLSAPEAERELSREDEERRHFLVHHFRVDPDDPTRYDLTLNSAEFSREQAAGLVVAAYRARFPEAAEEARAAAP